MLTYPEYAAALFDALRPDPFYRTLEEAYPDPAGARDAMLRYYDLSIREGAEWGRLGEPQNGAYGVSVWSVPLTPEEARRKQAAKEKGLVAAMGEACARTFAKIEAAMAEHEARLGLDGHWYLSILGVSPSVQGQGLGGGLLKPVLAQADAAGVSSYLTTFTPRNIPFYERQGYAVAGQFPEPTTGSEFTVLVRRPHALSATR